MSYKSGTDLILGKMVTNTFTPLGHSTSCKISDSTETGERKTKEAADGKFKEIYVKTLGESITADGFIYTGDSLGHPELKELWLAGEPVKLRYCLRGQETSKYYEGDYIITSLEQDGPAGDDQKWSVTFELSGALSTQPVG